ncbi:MAG: hypothetical protein KAR08_03885 [Candidatus Heimdallarchaeota archaeon]|nr:hypothetical protein [Candidatus Auribacterota bacterium]MCK5158270.1 hypothetical protein [Candidatus Heimdallarchaeota archaeon]
MNKKIKSGKDVIDEFFSEILNIEDVDQKTVEKLVELYKENNLTDRKIQNALEELKQAELNSKARNDGKD